MNNKNRERMRRDRERRMGGRRGGTSRLTWLMIALGAVALSAAIILGLVVLTRRQDQNSTATPAPNAAPSAAAALATATFTPEPPAATPTPSPDDLLKTAKSCKLIQNTSLRLVPSEAAGGDSVSAGISISITIRTVEPKGWLEVVRNGSLRYVKADQVEKGCGA